MWQKFGETDGLREDGRNAGYCGSLVVRMVVMLAVGKLGGDYCDGKIIAWVNSQVMRHIIRLSKFTVCKRQIMESQGVS